LADGVLCVCGHAKVRHMTGPCDWTRYSNVMVHCLCTEYSDRGPIDG
jgi:hypothetical protein